eukprot:12157268-Prorocentrum_lima.AAC.1
MQRKFQKESNAQKQARGEEVTETIDIVPTKLFPKNRSVERVNNEQLLALDGIAYTYMAQDWGDRSHLKQLQDHCSAPEQLTLRVRRRDG